MKTIKEMKFTKKQSKYVDSIAIGGFIVGLVVGISLIMTIVLLIDMF